ncbi:MAG: hypoxanthine phosphoribosyltransferase [Saprospiraceae bacterium]|nr:hypoxanthine phosphoribosyltransferase [Saprospiraceae bacterium]
MINCNGKDFEIFLTSEQIQNRLKEVCEEINVEYKDKKPIFLGILNGVFRVAGDVFKYIDIECEVSFVKLKSYEGTESSGKITTMLGLDTNLEGRDIILLEDIVDTGRTFHSFLPELHKLNPKSVSILTLLVKPDAMEYEIPLKYVGFSVPNHFLLGYGLDYDGLGRQLNDIYQIV